MPIDTDWARWLGQLKPIVFQASFLKRKAIQTNGTMMIVWVSGTSP